MATIVKPFTFASGALVVASEHNSNFDTIYTDYNGGITNANISASAAIVASKLSGVAASGANTDITSVYLNNTGLKIKDTNASHGLSIVPGSNITADKTLTIVTGDADRTITLAGALTTAADFITSGANSLTLTTTGATNVTLPTTGTLATLAGSEELDGKTLDSSVGKGTWTASGTWTLPALTLGGLTQLAEGASIALDAAGSADGAYSGITISGTAGATLAFGDLVYLAAADSRWELADADAASTSGDVILGMCVLAAASDADPTRILLIGNIRADAVFPALTIAAPAYVGTTAGDIQTAQPSGTDDVIRRVGFALTADELYFNPSNDYVTHT
jgi:hypothetical protein